MRRCLDYLGEMGEAQQSLDVASDATYIWVGRGRNVYHDPCHGVNVDETLKWVIERLSRDLDPDSRADQIIGLCLRHNLFATRDYQQGRVLVGTLDKYLGSVDIGDDWTCVEEKIIAMSMIGTWG